MPKAGVPPGNLWVTHLQLYQMTHGLSIPHLDGKLGLWSGSFLSGDSVPHLHQVRRYTGQNPHEHHWQQHCQRADRPPGWLIPPHKKEPQPKSYHDTESSPQPLTPSMVRGTACNHACQQTLGQHDRHLRSKFEAFNPWRVQP
jgi:hypothetical protein